MKIPTIIIYTIVMWIAAGVLVGLAYDGVKQDRGIVWWHTTLMILSALVAIFSAVKIWQLAYNDLQSK